MQNNGQDYSQQQIISWTLWINGVDKLLTKCCAGEKQMENQNKSHYETAIITMA